MVTSCAQLEMLVHNLGVVSKVKFPGRVDSAILPSLYAMADVFVMPSLSEGHCVSILEAMSAGKPVIASNISANAESVENGKNGFLIPLRNPDAIASSILQVFRDDSLRKKQGEYSRQRALSEFSWAQRTNRLVGFYKSILDSKQIK